MISLGPILKFNCVSLDLHNGQTMDCLEFKNVLNCLSLKLGYTDNVIKELEGGGCVDGSKNLKRDCLALSKNMLITVKQFLRYNF